ncbi:hypothetical protein K1719_022898 [Acacia pycnantha]|nr:hypothetical protein K1719_022898 [Acacia pycnantha]
MGMQVLIEHSLVKVVNDKIHVHDLLQEIGREIPTDNQKFTYIYDVFLSFRGEDTRKSFATLLYTTLNQAGIKVFMRITYQEVLPIFYDVQPSEVLKQQNAFGKAWEKLVTTFPFSKDRKVANSLKKALIEAANVSGWDMQNYRYCYFVYL